jgi:apolipoprotein N-acyltransferase
VLCDWSNLLQTHRHTVTITSSPSNYIAAPHTHTMQWLIYFCLILLVRVVDVHVESCIVLITSVFVFSLDFPVLPWFSVSIGSCYAAVALTKWDGHQLRQKEGSYASSDVYT